ncbi:MAG: ribosomal RNA small subunit methyltransferase A [Desulfobacteraceae bacterium 4572_130]|nr:MAG: ribosomal RNA small subunit methyltransferase A [Desulfobacteraceae bacterium 4572_130]
MIYPGTLLKAWNLFPKKKLGQNFLLDSNTAETIVDHAKISKNDIVLEIGAGLGALTIHISKKAHKVYAVEKDTNLVMLLKNELAKTGADNVEIINKDILKLDFDKLGLEKNLIVIGNLPYNISSQILLKLIEKRIYIKKAVLMLQKELAQRIQAASGTKAYGRLSAVVQYCSKIETLINVSPNVFFPKPEIESKVIKITFLKKTCFRGDKEKFHFKVIKAAFSKRRKTLKNSLSRSELEINADQAFFALKNAGIDPVRRAETLSIKEFIDLTKELLLIEKYRIIK